MYLISQERKCTQHLIYHRKCCFEYGHVNNFLTKSNKHKGLSRTNFYRPDTLQLYCDCYEGKSFT